jgi:membrane protein implicated in regulation of membrane protease activity
MTWSASTIWWLATGALVVAELATGTIYLLMLALGAAAGAVAAHLGLATEGQLATAALLGGGAVGFWHLRRVRHPAALPASANPDVNLDIGSNVQVPAWQPDGSARVSYRGADWDARFVGSGPAAPGWHVIHAVEGNRLLLDRAAH